MLGTVVRGVLVGLATCLTFGPVTVMVARAGFERRVAAAIACGMGAALVDVVESQLAYLGVAQLLRAAPGAIAVLYVAGGVLFVASGLRIWKRKEVPDADVGSGSRARAFVRGVVLTAVNPATLLGWIALAGSLFSDLDRAAAAFASAGVGLGVALWFVGIALAAARGSAVLGARTHVVTRALDLVLASAGVYLVVRGALVAIRG